MTLYTKTKLRSLLSYVHVLPPLLVAPEVSGTGWIGALGLWTLAGLVAGWNANQVDRQRRLTNRAHDVAFKLDARLMVACKIMKAIEWREGLMGPECPCCRRVKESGHSIGCGLNRFLKEEI